MKKKERLSEFNQKNIIDAAKKLFIANGIFHTSMDEISREAEYSKSTIYVYFKSKEEIYNYIILEHFELLKNAVCDALRDSPGFPEGFFAVCHALADGYENYPLFFESILSEIKFPENESQTVLIKIHKVGEEINSVIENYLQRCVDEKKITLDVSPLQATMTLWASITGLISFAHKKEIYIKNSTGASKKIFIENGFRALLKTIT